MPAIFQPISVASIEPGPGAARDSAKRSANSRSSVQWWTAIDCWAMSAMTALPPPNDRSERGAKTSASARSVSPEPWRTSGSARPDERQRDAERRHDGDDRQERPAEHPDRHRRRAGDDERKRA